MPVDENGNVADVVMDPTSVVSRMNIGRLYEHYINAAIRDVSLNIRKIVNLNKINGDELVNINISIINKAYEYLLGFYEIVSNRQYDFFKNKITDEEKYEHLKDVINDGVYIYYPIENEKEIINMVKQLEIYYKPVYGKVKYIGNSGNEITTINNVRIAPLYLMLLEKIADDWSAVSTGKLQSFGVLAPMTRYDKFTYPFRNTAVRAAGETECRIFAGYCGREMAAELMDRSNNPLTQRNMVYNILDADKPTNINHVVNRNYIKLGSGKNLQLVKHIFSCAGFKTTYEPEDR